MTRFARAKGSKSSNERKLEEPTSWSEMKKSMLLKKNKTPGKKYFSDKVIANESHQKETEWAALTDDSFGDSMSVLKQHMTKGSKEGNKLENEDERKKKGLHKMTEETNIFINENSMMTKENVETSVNDESEGNMKKRGKKRKKNEVKEPFKKKVKIMERINEKVEKKEKEVISKFQKNESKSKSLKKRNIHGDEQNHFQKKLKNKFQNKSFNKDSSLVEELIINGEKIEIVKFQGFYVTLEDAERLKKLRSEMKKEGIPKDKLEAAIKLERRRAEKALSRLKKNVCFHCRSRGHLLSNCPDLQEKETTGTGICYKCGSTEHSAGECKVVRGSQFQFAECFICREQGHIARQCPDNPRGLYPQGGACRECGDVTHLRKDCPKVLLQKEEEAVTVGVRSERNLECLDEEIVEGEKRKNSKRNHKKNSTVKF